MALHYWRTKIGIGASGLGTEEAPFTAKQLADAMIAGTVVPGDATMLMGERGPIGLADAADFPAHTATAQTALKITGYSPSNAIPPANAANSSNYGRNIVFGTTADDTIGTTSKASGISFLARGGSKASPNVDMRGMTTNAERQMAAIIIQGYDFPEISGFYIRPGDWNYVAAGRVGNTTATPAGESDRPTEASFENIGLMVRGGWGSKIRDIYVHGGNHCHTGVMIGWRSYNTDPTKYANKGIHLLNVEAESCGVDAVAVEPGRQIHAGSSREMPNGAWILLENVSGHDAYFYMSGYDNQALRFANLVAINECRAARGNSVRMKNVRAWGDCQDAVLLLGVNLVGEYFDIFDTCPTWEPGATFNYVTNSGTGWGGTTGTVQGVGLKVGLGESYEGTPAGGLFGAGTVGGTYSADQLRQTVLYSSIRNTKGVGMTTNGSSGMVLHASEIDTPHAHAFQAVVRTKAGWHLLTNNFLRGTRGIYVEAYNKVGAWNNIAVGTTASAGITGTGAELYGARNIRSGPIGGSPTWSAIDAVPDYTVGVGPTAGGNCDNAGDWAGLMEHRRRAAMYDMAGRLWRAGRLPIGPRQL